MCGRSPNTLKGIALRRPSDHDGRMDNDARIDEPYESPTLEVVGTLHELTNTGALPNADGLNQQNTANPFIPPAS